MIKDYQINDILSAVIRISKLDKKKRKITEIKNDFSHKNDISPNNNQVKPNKSDILVLNEMIE